MTLDCNGAGERHTVIGNTAEKGMFVVDGTRLFWIESPGLIRSAAPGAVESDIVTLASAQGPVSLAVDAEHVSWTNGDGTIRSVARNGGMPVTIASDQSGARGIALRGRRLYWANAGDGTIRSAPN